MIDKVSRILFQTSELRVSSTVSLPSFSYYKKKDGNYSFPLMDKPATYLSMSINPVSRKEVRFEEKNVFFLEPEYYELVKAWIEVWDWFRDPNMKDLFIYDEENKLQFNSAYNSLRKTVSDSKKIPQRLTIMPALVTRGDKTHEGVFLHLISIDIQTTLTKNEFGSLLRILKEYSFSYEPIFLAGAYLYAEMHKSVRENAGFSKLSSDNKINDILNGTVIQNRNQAKGFQFK